MTILVSVCGLLALADAPPGSELPDPLSLGHVVRIAREHRQEPVAARARADAAGERAAIVSSLDDPMIMGAVDHLPFGLHGYDASVMIEQRFPLSRELRNRRLAAEAQGHRQRADANRTVLDVELDAARAFFMLYERRRLLETIRAQELLAQQIVSSAKARYATGGGATVDVLRAETERERLRTELVATAAEVTAAEAMLNASLGRPGTAPLPQLATPTALPLLPPREAVLQAALGARPELAGGRAEIAGADAEVQVMRSMDAPMAMVRLGVARTMTERAGLMGLFGVSVPIYRDKRRAAVREAESMAKMARADVAAMTRMIEGEALAARDNVLAARTRHQLLEQEVLPRARQAVEAALSAYGAGQGAMVSVLESVSALWSVQAEEVMAASAAGLAQARLRRAMGIRSEAGTHPGERK